MDDKYLDLMATEMAATQDSFRTLPSPSAGQPEGSPKPPSVESSNSDQLQAYSLRKAQVIFACYRKDEAHDPEMYAAAVAAVLSTYPVSIIDYTADPRMGIASISKWLPSVAEIKEFCDNQVNRIARHRERDARIEQQLKERAMDTAPRVDLNKYKDKYGNWLHSDKENSIPSDMQKRVYTEAEKKAFLDDAIATGFEFSISRPKLLRATLKAMQEKDDFEKKFT